MNLDIIGWGALNVDRLCHVNEFVKEDGETFITSETKTPGGSAANTIVGLAKLGVNTGYVGKVGYDDNGEILTFYLEQNNVDTENLIKSDGGSGEVIGFIDNHGKRKLYVTPRSNDRISLDEINVEYLRKARIVHLTSFVGLNPKDPSIETQFKVLEMIKDDVTVSFDPGMLYVTRSNEFINRLLELTDILLINETELKIMMHTDSLKDAVSKVEDSVDILVVKKSTDGSYIKKDNEEYEVGIFNVDTVDTTGAGDVYNAGFLYGLIKDYSLFDSAIIGSYIAAQSTTKTGATDSIPEIKDIDISDIIQSFKK